MTNDSAVLLIDDSYIDRMVTSMLITNTFGITDIHEANGGKRALEILTTNEIDKNKKLIVLLDIKMPEMNGFEFLDELDKLGKILRDNIHVVMLSSTIDPDDIEQAERHPRVKALLSKPLSVNELKKFIQLK